MAKTITISIPTADEADIEASCRDRGFDQLIKDADGKDVRDPDYDPTDAFFQSLVYAELRAVRIRRLEAEVEAEEAKTTPDNAKIKDALLKVRKLRRS